MITYASDSLMMTTKVQCTEDDGADLDDLLRKNEYDGDVWTSLTNDPSKSSFAFLSSSPSLLNQAGSTQPSPECTSGAAAIVSDCAIESISIDKEIRKEVTPSSPSNPPITITAREEDEDDYWFMPPPAQPGDFLNIAAKRVPRKSILKKASSYGNFDGCVPTHICCTHQSQQKKFVVMDSEANATLRVGMRKRSSLMTFSTASASSIQSETSVGSSYDLGIEELSSLIYSPQSPKISQVEKSKIENIPVMPIMPTLTTGADATSSSSATGSSLGMSSGSSSRKINRSVSFTSVDVREYARTVGDNPACHSGPPLSLDWSYSKKYEQPKTLDEYETEKKAEQDQNFYKLRSVNKYRRRNMLSFHWGHSEEEMKNARRETKKLQRQRSLTQLLLPLHMTQEAFINFERFVAKKRGMAESRKQELQRLSRELSLSNSNKST